MAGCCMEEDREGTVQVGGTQERLGDSMFHKEVEVAHCGLCFVSAIIVHPPGSPVRSPFLTCGCP